ncbi:MAG: translation initiation factor [Sphingobacteriales bacterium]|nr:MAG: translation initiation factor [Sphingobacteriales bacterium]
MSKQQNWKERLGTVYSTDQNFNYNYNEETEQQTLENNKQILYIKTDNKQRKGKTVTLISNFIGTDEDLQTLTKMLKTKCGVGGTAKDNEIMIQGDFKQKIKEILEKENYKTKLH